MAFLTAMARENRRLKHMYADCCMQIDLLKEALGKNGPASSTPEASLRAATGSRPQANAVKVLAMKGVSLAFDQCSRTNGDQWSYRAGRSMSERPATDTARAALASTVGDTLQRQTWRHGAPKLRAGGKANPRSVRSVR